MEPLTAARQEAALEALFEIAAVGLVLLDGGGRVVRVNPAFARLFGYSAEQAGGCLLEDLLGSPGEPQEVALAIERLLAGEPLALETWCRRSGGQPVAVALSGAPLSLADGSGAWCALRDITDQRLAEEQGARAASLHHATLESTADGATGRSAALHEGLSDREYEVLCQLGSGRTVKEISVELRLSPKTVSTYRTRLLEKMRVAGNADLVRYAAHHGLIQ